MALRLRALSSVDPLSVPLPAGTEVTTRVDRQLGERVVPQGAIGRVRATEGELLLVHIVGVGPVRYARVELLPRKLGQLQYAARRAETWSALQPCVVLETTVGSRAWGLAEEGSDVDRRGVFGLPFSWSLGLAPPTEELVSLDASATYWELGKAVRQALRADPNTLEMLFLPSARASDPLGEWLLADRTAFVSQEIYASFGRYALSQLKKLAQSLRLAEHRELVMSWLRAEPELDLDRLAVRLAKETVRDAPSERDAVFRARDYVKQLYRSLYDQGVIPAGDFESLVALARAESEHGFELPRELRPKNAYNLLRLLHLAIGWLENGEPVFEVQGALRTRLLSIKRGEVSLGEVMAEAEALTPALEQARGTTRLPERADFARAHALLVRAGEELARRHVLQLPGPFGAGAPQMDLSFEDR